MAFINPDLEDTFSARFNGRDIARTSKIISAQFETIENHVRSFTDSWGGGHTSTWNGLKHTWYRTLKDSKDLAIAITSLSEDFESQVARPVSVAIDSADSYQIINRTLRYLGIISESNADGGIDRGICVLTQHIERADRNMAKAKAIADSLSDLKLSVGRFGDSIRSYASSLTSQGRDLSTALQSDLQSRQQRSAETYQQARGLWATGFALNIAGIGAAILCPVAAPALAAYTATAVVGGLAYRSDRQVAELEGQIAGEEVLVRLVNELLDQIQRANSELSSCYFSTVINNMELLRATWAAANMACKTVQDHLNKTKDTGHQSAPSILIIGFLKLANTHYVSLGKELRAYTSEL